MIFKCKICGGSLNVEEDSKIITCDYCGTKQTLPKLENDKVANLYDRANHFRRNNEYDKAEAIYEMILNENAKDAECYWSLVLCKFGVEYVEDPKTHEYVPTCHRTQNTSILADENYRQALKFAEEEQKLLYEKEAEKINKIQKGILEISRKEEPFDVFICYKETDEQGKRTEDSVIAQEIYNKLTKEGLKVFFAKITLEDKIGESYEPYIFAALSSAKAMLVIGTKKEYFEAPWVKNEWSRYLGLIQNGENKTLIPCFKDMDAYDLPEQFAHLQAQDMSRLGFEQDIIHGVKKIVGGETQNNKKRNKKPIVWIIVLILAIIIAIAVTTVIMKPDNTENVDNNEAGEKEESREILMENVFAENGYTFNMTVEELKTKLLETVKDMGYVSNMIEAKEVVLQGGDGYTYLAIGWHMNEHGASVDDDFVGLNIDYCGEYVTSVSCIPTKYGSGDPTPSVVPINLYEKAKEILGSQTQEWRELTMRGNILEITYDAYTGEEAKGSELEVGTTRTLYATRPN